MKVTFGKHQRYFAAMSEEFTPDKCFEKSNKRNECVIELSEHQAECLSDALNQWLHGITIKTCSPGRRA